MDNSNKEIATGIRKEPPSAEEDNPPSESKKPRRHDEMRKPPSTDNDISSLQVEYDRISLPLNDKSITDQPPLEEVNFGITDEDYPVKSKPIYKKSNANLQSSTQVNVPKLTNSSFQKAGFFTSNNVASKLDKEDWRLMETTTAPLLPLTTDVTDARDNLAALKKKLENLLRSYSMSGDESNPIEEVAEILRKVTTCLNDIDSDISTLKKNISGVESVRKRARLFMEACIQLNKYSSIAKWSKLASRSTALLRLVDEEKERMKEAAASAETASAQTSSAETASEDDEVQIIEPNTATDGEAQAPVELVSTDTTSNAIQLPKAANGERKGRKTKKAAPTQEERVKRDAELYIPFKKFQDQLNGGIRKKKGSLHDQSLVWKDGQVYCKCCGHDRIKFLKNVDRHVNTDKHKKNLAEARSSKVPLYQEGIKNVDPHAMGAHQDTPRLAYQMKAMIAAGKHNIPVTNVAGLAEDCVDDYADETLGNVGDFSALAAPAVHKAITERIRDILAGHGCYDEFAVTFDGTPSFAEAEAVIVRIVTKDGVILELLVCCGLYEKKLNAENLKCHVIDTITNRVGLELKNWLSTHQDR